MASREIWVKLIVETDAELSPETNDEIVESLTDHEGDITMEGPDGYGVPTRFIITDAEQQ